jgi:hypothetical protein
MGERWKDGGEEDCNPLNQERKEDSQAEGLEARDGGQAPARADHGKTRRKVTGNLCKKAFFDSLN